MYSILQKRALRFLGSKIYPGCISSYIKMAIAVILFIRPTLRSICWMYNSGLYLEILGLTIILVHVFLLNGREYTKNAVMGSLLVPLAISYLSSNSSKAAHTGGYPIEALYKYLLLSIEGSINVLPLDWFFGIRRWNSSFMSLCLLAVWHILRAAYGYGEGQLYLNALAVRLILSIYFKKVFRGTINYGEAGILSSLLSLLFMHYGSNFISKCYSPSVLSARYIHMSTEAFYAETLLVSVLILYIVADLYFPLARFIAYNLFGFLKTKTAKQISSLIYIYATLILPLVFIRAYNQCSNPVELLRGVMYNPMGEITQVAKTFCKFAELERNPIIYALIITILTLIIPFLSRSHLKKVTNPYSVEQSRTCALKLYFYRKSFHLLALMLFLPLISSNSRFLNISSTVVLGLMIYAESLKTHDVWMLGGFLRRSVAHLLNEKDKNGITHSHIYLMFCYASASAIHGVFNVDLEVSINIIMAIGIGDSAASLIGLYFGGPKFYRSTKTLVGTFAFVASSCAAHFVFKELLLLFSESHHEFKSYIRAPASYYIVIYQGFVEALYCCNDNMTIPLYTISLGSSKYYMDSKGCLDLFSYQVIPALMASYKLAVKTLRNAKEYHNVQNPSMFIEFPSDAIYKLYYYALEYVDERPNLVSNVGRLFLLAKHLLLNLKRRLVDLRSMTMSGLYSRKYYDLRNFITLLTGMVRSIGLKLREYAPEHVGKELPSVDAIKQYALHVKYLLLNLMNNIITLCLALISRLPNYAPVRNVGDNMVYKMQLIIANLVGNFDNLCQTFGSSAINYYEVVRHFLSDLYHQQD